MKQRSIRVGFVDDHPAMLRGLALSAWKETNKWKRPIEFVKLSETVDLLLEASPRGMFDVVALDLSLEDGSTPADNVRRLLDEGYPVLIYSGSNNVNDLHEALAAGASGIAPKNDDPKETMYLLRRVADGETIDNKELADAIATDTKFVSANLSPREQETLSLYAAGYTQKQVAEAMNIGKDAVGTNIYRIRKKFAAVGREARTKLELYHRAVEDGFFVPPTQ
jgi:two-component system nitrate/nitrite response regulator NarL